MDDLDALLGSFDLEPKDIAPKSTEEHFLDLLTEGKHQKIYNLRYHLNRELKYFDFLKSKNLTPRREILQEGRVIYKLLTDLEYARLVIEYAIHAQFDASLKVAEHHGKAKADLSKVVDLVISVDEIKNVVENTFFLR